MHLLFLPISLLFLPKLSEQSIIIEPMYVPTHSLRKIDICSVMSIAFPSPDNEAWKRRVDYHHSRRTMLYFILSIKSTSNNKRLLDFIYECYSKFDWSTVTKLYLHLKNSTERYQAQYHAETFGKYWEMKISNNFHGLINSRTYISQYRSYGFQPNELKIYWNYDQIQELTKCYYYDPTTDSDARDALSKSPVHTRRHSGTIQFIISGIQDAVFKVPEGKQVIVLDFADERMPGGYYLENARTQEEVSVNIEIDFSFIFLSIIGYSL
jgi:hypothetical protein